MMRAVSFPVCHLEVRLFAEIKESLSLCDSSFVEYSFFPSVGSNIFFSYHLKTVMQETLKLRGLVMSRAGRPKVWNDNSPLLHQRPSFHLIDRWASRAPVEQQCIDREEHLFALVPQSAAGKARSRTSVRVPLVICSLPGILLVSENFFKSPFPSGMFHLKAGRGATTRISQHCEIKNGLIYLASTVTEIFITCHMECLSFKREQIRSNHTKLLLFHSFMWFNLIVNIIYLFLMTDYQEDYRYNCY